MYCINGEVTLDDGAKYMFVEQHRKQNAVKSKWIISFAEEHTCFSLAYNNRWIDTNKGWGLHFLENRISQLGISRSGQRLFIAKFVDSTNNNVWHGYPADYVSNIHDRPATSVLSDWVDREYIDKTGMNRIISGKRGRI